MLVWSYDFRVRSHCNRVHDQRACQIQNMHFEYNAWRTGHHAISPTTSRTISSYMYLHSAWGYEFWIAPAQSGLPTENNWTWFHSYMYIPGAGIYWCNPAVLHDHVQLHDSWSILSVGLFAYFKWKFYMADLKMTNCCWPFYGDCSLTLLKIFQKNRVL